jgi:PAS domain S-box-containing protein
VVLDDMHRQSRAFLDRAQAIVRTNPLASILTDAESHKVIDVNEAFLRMFGLSMQQIVDRPTDELGLFDSERLTAYRQLLRTNGAVEDLIVTRSTDEGENRTLRISGHRLTLDEKDFYLTFIRDISNEMRAANLLRREKEGAQNEARVKSQFLAMMSHEFRTPLTAAAGLAALLKEDEHDREKRRRLDGIIAATSALTHLVDDVLDLSRLENNELVTLCRTFDPGSVVERVEAICSAAAARKGLAFTIEIDPRLPHRIVGDQNRIAQVAINLMHNAIKFTDSGSVTLFIGRASSRGEVAERLVVEVRDTGPGIDPNDRKRLFQPFQQGRTAKPPEGAGLGLAICRHLVALMDGRVIVRPNPEGGSVFRVDLPLVVGVPDLPDGRARIAASDTGRHWAGLKVLVAEDAALNREVLTQQLVSAGAEVVSVADGESACILAATAEPRFDVVLLDMSMPGLSGPEASERLRLTWRGQTLPIVALTASSEEVDRRACEAAGMDLFVSKPYDLVDVGRQIGAILAASNHCEPTSSIGFDHVAAARGWADDATPLATLLVGFADTHDDIGGKLTALRRENRIDDLRTSVHRLRGLAALLQANRLNEAAARIEARVAANKSASDLKEDLDRLEQLVLAHVDLINSTRDGSRFAEVAPQSVHA